MIHISKFEHVEVELEDEVLNTLRYVESKLLGSAVVRCTVNTIHVFLRCDTSKITSLLPSFHSKHKERRKKDFS